MNADGSDTRASSEERAKGHVVEPSPNVTKRRPTWWLVFAAGVVLFTALPFIGLSAFQLHLLITAAIFAMAGLGVFVVFQVGEVTLAQAGFMAIGGYVSALLSRSGTVAVPVAMLAGIVVSIVIALFLGRVILRAGGEFYFLLITFSFAEIVRLAVHRWGGGPDGIAGIPSASLFGISFDGRREAYLLALAALVLLIVLTRVLLTSEVGRVFLMIREGRHDVAPAAGVDTLKYMLLAFTIGSAMAGLAGVLYGHYLNFIAPNLFTVAVTILILTVTVVGGMHSMWGPLIGAIAIIGLRDNLRAYPEMHVLIYGVALVVMMLFLREGLIGLGERVLRHGSRGAETSPGGGTDG